MSMFILKKLEYSLLSINWIIFVQKFADLLEIHTN